MVRDKPDGHILVLVFLINDSCDLAYLVAQSLDGVYIKDGVHILDNYCQTLQPHTCIYIFLLQLFIMSFAVIFKLGKYIIPDLHITVTVASHSTSFFSASVLLTAVIVYFRTWPAGSCTVLPEIIFLPKTEDPLCRDADLLVPDLKCIVILQINRRIEPVRVKSDYLCKEFP